VKILLANKYYYHRGGAEVYVINLESLLREKGHDVAVFSMQHPMNLPSPYSVFFPSPIDFSNLRFRDVFKYIMRPMGSGEVKVKFSRMLDQFAPDVLHLNNIHSQLSPLIAQIAHQKGIKIVWTIHDYKMLCPRYDCLRDGQPCQLCNNDKWSVVRYNCMKNNIIASIIAWREAVKWNRQRLESYTDTFICPSQFIKNQFVSGGFDETKLKVIPNFVSFSPAIDTVSTHREDYYCYIGRLSKEKGMETLLTVAQQLPYTLKIAGNGPLFNDLKSHYECSHIKFLGHLQPHEVKSLLGKALFSVIPSEWYENNPLSVIESLCLGTPVLGANIGGIPELIEENRNGLLFMPRRQDELKFQIQKLFNHSSVFDYKVIAETADKKFAAKNHLCALMELYG
jgi:glycosyltransferase involved in cell wall biosynthesis